MEDTKKYLDLEGLKAYHERLLQLKEAEKQILLNIIDNKMEIGKLGVEEEDV